MNMANKTIRIRETTYDRLVANGKYAETMDILIGRLLDEVDEARKARRSTAQATAGKR